MGPGSDRLLNNSSKLLPDINAIAFNSAGVSLVHFLCTWISKYSLLPGKVENTKIKS